MTTLPAFVGLDLETSGTNIDAGAVPIQLGLAYQGEVFSELIGGWEWGTGATWSETAEEVHRIPQEHIYGAKWPDEVDTAARFWLKEHGLTRRPQVHVVGWNVAGFDMPFVKRYLPQTFRMLSYRTVDLNAVLFAIVHSGKPRPTGLAWTYDELKRSVKTEAGRLAEETTEAGWHDAGFDALAAVYAFDILKRYVR